LLKQFTIKSRGLFPPTNGPFRASRSRIEQFGECPLCFWLEHRRGIRRPSSPPLLIYSLVDRLLKREFDAHRLAGTPHPIMLANSIPAVPFADPRIDDWRMTTRGVMHLHEPTGLLITGAIDDVWQLDGGELAVVDYKATAKAAGVTIDEDWQQGYKRQIEVYQWLFRRNGFRVSNTGFFVYCNGQDAECFDERVKFATKLIPYTGDDAWIEPTLLDLKRCLTSDSPPHASIDCEYCGYAEARKLINK
jgi:hypothetical protein